MAAQKSIDQLLDQARRSSSPGLVIRNLALEELPDAWHELAFLTELHASRNQLRSLPPTFVHLVRLEELDLRKNRFSHLPNELFALTSLRVLNLGDNRITSLEGIGQLGSLTCLDVSFNEVRRLPADLRALHRLEKLDLSANRLTHVNLAAHDLPALTELRVSGNPIVQLPESLWSRPALEWLYVDPAQDRAVPEAIRRRGRPVIRVE